MTTISLTIKTCEMHTGGEPVRIVESGYPDLPKLDTVLDMRRYLQTHHDDYRRLLMLEPRGHSDMYGVILIDPINSDSDAGVLFMHNSGYSTMCGHATIALGRYLVDKALRDGKKLSLNQQKQCELTLDAPCGLVKVWVNMEQEGPEKHSVKFLNVESFVVVTDLKLTIDGVGLQQTFKVDVAYGGAFYVFVQAKSVGIEFGKTPTMGIIHKANLIKDKVQKSIEIKHPVHEDLSFLYGVIFTDDTKLRDKEDPSSTNLCIYAEGQVDRSPCGSGATARMPLLYEKGVVNVNTQPITFISALTGSKFTGKIVRESTWRDKRCVQVEVQGKAYYTGRCEFTYEKNDELAFGFRV